MKNITLSINGINISCPAGTSILNAAEKEGIKIPTLCSHPDLEPFGACRLCLVEDQKSGRIMASCVTPVAADMAILTETPRIKTHRRNILRLMIAEHPESCVVCSKGNRCQLRHLAAQLGIAETNLYPMPNYKTLEEANPFIIRDLSKCILCGKCIRADHELVVVGAIDYNLRGFKSRPTPVHDLGLEHSNCTFCGTCVSMCPTGALSQKNKGYVGTPEREFFSVCGFCGVGCSLAMGVADEKIMEVNPAHLQNTVNGATLCVRGHFAHDFLNTSQRLSQPMARKNGMRGDDQMVPVAWEELLDGIATKLLEIRGKYGPQSIAFLGSTKCTNEENYLFQKIARALLKTNNVDNGGYIWGRSALHHLDSRTGGQWRTRPLADLEKAEAIFVLGADPGHSAPVLGYHLKRAAKRGVPMLVANSCPTDLENLATFEFNLALNGTSGKGYPELLNGLAALLVKKKGHNTASIKQHSKGFGPYREKLSAVDLAGIRQVTGIDKSVLDAAAELLKGKKIAFVIGNGIFLDRHGMQSIDAVVNLALLTGSLGSTGAGIHVIAAENNLIGAWDMGTVPDALPGRRFLDEKSAQKHFQKAWQTEISADEGCNVIGMIEAAEKGTLKALYVLGENPLRSLPQPDRVRQALDNLDFIVVQDIIISETAKMADALLPGAAFSEKGGSFTNLEGKIQSFNPVVPPPGDARPDWKILSRLAANLGDNTPYNSLGDIVDEIRRLVPMYADLYRGRHSAWVKASDLQAGKKTAGNKYRMSFSLPASPANQEDAEPPDQTYPLTAIIVSRRYHLGSGTRTACSDRISEFGLKGEIEVSVEDAAKLDLTAGDTVRVFSLHGELKREIKLNSRLHTGQIFIPLAFDNNAAMNLIEMTRLEVSDSPGWKTCRVKIEKVSALSPEGPV